MKEDNLTKEDIKLDTVSLSNKLTSVVPTERRGKGRPKKSEIESRSKQRKGQIGRPPGEAAKIKELMARMLLTNGDRVLEKTIKIALEDGNPNQMAAIKLLMDRALPVSYFESKSEGQNNGQGVIINITGLSPQIQSSQDVDDNVVDIEVSDGQN
jgi:hypothetical protein